MVSPIDPSFTLNNAVEQSRELQLLLGLNTFEKISRMKTEMLHNQILAIS